MIDVRGLDLRKLNSLTKYPSILTYHNLDPKTGALLDEVLVPLTGELIATEKVDGANGRLIIFPDGMFILGSREELLYGKGDLIENPKEGIVEALKPLGMQLTKEGENAPWLALGMYNAVSVFYVEVYGGNVGGSGRAFKQYTGTNQLGYRLFDVAWFTLSEFTEYMTWPVEKYSGWRERGGQPFLCEEELQKVVGVCGIGKVPLELTPRISIAPIPTGLDDTYQWLNTSIPNSWCTLDGGGLGKPEGLVVRSPNRKLIAKIRYEDYQRTMRKRGQK